MWRLLSTPLPNIDAAPQTFDFVLGRPLAGLDPHVLTCVAQAQGALAHINPSLWIAVFLFE